MKVINIYKKFSTFSRFLAFSFLLGLVVSVSVFSLIPMFVSALYAPGFTLDPDCLPTDPTCTVSNDWTTAISAPNFIGTSTGMNTGDITLTNNTNGLTISGQALTLGLSGASATGTLSATDWNTFNNKQAAGAYLTSYSESDPLWSIASSSYLSIVTANSNYPTFSYASSTYYLASNPNSYISSFAELDPVYTTSSWSTTTNNSTNWNTAYGWGNHANAGYLTTALASSTYLSIATASSTYQPIGLYLTSESDSIWLSASTSYAALSGATFTGTVNGNTFSMSSTTGSSNFLGNLSIGTTSNGAVITGTAAGFVVTDCGNSAWNGNYSDTGLLYGGRPYYMKDASHYIWYLSGPTVWIFSDLVGGGTTAYWVASDTATPPTDRTWETSTTPPGPTLVYGVPGSVGPANRLTLQGSDILDSTGALSILNASSTSLFYVNNAGNVGIGSSSPLFKLTVTGNAYISDVLTVASTTGTSTFAGNILMGGDLIPNGDKLYSLGSVTNEWKHLYVGNGSIYINGQRVLGEDASHNINVTADANQNLIFKTYGNGDLELNPLGDATSTGRILLKGDILLTANKKFVGGALFDNLSVADNTLQAVNINGSLFLNATGTGGVYFNQGNVGIGTTSGASKLTVSGDINFTGNLYQNGALFSSGTSLSLVSGSSTGLTLNSSALSITDGYNIPLTASTTAWNNLLSNVLALNNTTVFTPTANYHPATKKYVDDLVAGISGTSSSSGGLSLETITASGTASVGKLYTNTGATTDFTMNLPTSSPDGSTIGFMNVTGGSGIDSYNKLMLHMNDTGLADSSAMSHIMTKNGGVVRSSTQSKFGVYSAYFDGAGDYLSTPDSTDFDFTSEDGTIDFWIYPTTVGINQGLIGQVNQNSNWCVYIKSNGGIAMGIAGVNEPVTTSAGALTANVWQHIAIIRSGIYTKIYINGIESASGDNTGWSNSPENLLIGYHRYNATDNYFNGYIDELRVSKGIARWTSDFTSSIIEYGNGGLITVSPAATESIYPYSNGEAVVLSSEGSKLSLIKNNGKWYDASFGIGGGGTLAIPSLTGNVGKYLTNDGSALSWADVTGTSGTSSGLTLTTITASGTAVVGNLYSNSSSTVDYTMTLPSDSPDGSTIAFMNLVGVGGIDSYAKLMLHMNNNATDSSTSNHTPTATDITYTDSPGDFKFGYSAIFNGSTSFISYPDSSDFDLAGGDFTIDAWIYLNDISGFKLIYSQANSSGYSPIYFGITGNKLDVLYSTDGNSWVNAGDRESLTILTPTTWTHVALVVSNHILKTYINGTLDKTFNSGSPIGTLVNSDGVAKVGRYNDSYPSMFSGKMDELRVSKGIARWTADFTPPVLEYSDGVGGAIVVDPANDESIFPYANGVAVNLDAVGEKLSLIKYGNKWYDAAFGIGGALTLPDQTGNVGKYLTTNGSGTLSWADVSGVSSNGLTLTTIIASGTATVGNLYTNLGATTDFTMTLPSGGVDGSTIGFMNVIGTNGCTGGTITNVGDYTINTFTSSSTLVCPAGVTAEVLVVAGGGGGGSDAAAGGGGGGVIHSNSVSLNAQSYPVVVGLGGEGGIGTYNSVTDATNGGDSSFNSMVAIGGGAGGGRSSSYRSGHPGGSGGGASHAGGVGTPGDADYISPRQGYDGGAGVEESIGAGGGGGGAGGVGGDASFRTGGVGGVGVSYDISGATTTYAGGGGGSGTTAAAGGAGGGGAGGESGLGGSPGTPNTGGGGGGGYYAVNSASSGDGGSGIVIVKYLRQNSSLITITPPSGESIASSATDESVILDARGEKISLIKYGNKWYDAAFGIGGGSTASTTITSATTFAIGTTTSLATLTVSGNTYISDVLTVASTTGVSSILGKLSIGTSTSLATLTIAGDLSLSGKIFDTNYSAGTLGMILQSTGTSTQWVSTSSLGISGGSSAPELVTITSSGTTTIDSSYNGKLITNAGATNDITLQLPSRASVGNNFEVGIVDEVEKASSASLKLYLKMNGANNGTSFIDTSTYNVSVTTSGVLTNTDTTKIGSASGYFNGGSTLNIPTSNNLVSGSGDFTVEFWMYMNNVSGRKGIYAPSADNGFIIEAWDNRLCLWAKSVDGGWNIIQSDSGTPTTSGRGSAILTAGNWTHVAVVRNGNNVRTYINGVVDVDYNITPGVSIQNPGTTRYIGWATSRGYFNGYIDNFIIDYAANYTSNFTPPLTETEVISSRITITPDGADTLPGTSAAGNSIVSYAKGDYLKLRTTDAGWIAESLISSSSWVNMSDSTTWNPSSRSVKENFTQLDKQDILNKISSLDMTQWNYIAQDDGVTHIGPIAEDFYGLFGLGGTDKAISTIDPAGIALVGIQALNKNLQYIFGTTSIESLANSTSTLETYTVTDLFAGMVKSALQKLSSTFIDTILSVKGMVIGSASQPSGLTIYDQTTKEPYCLKMNNGAMVTIPGTCSDSSQEQSLTDEKTTDSGPGPASTEEVTIPTETSTTTETSTSIEETATTTEPVVEDTATTTPPTTEPEPTPITSEIPPVEPEPTPEPTPTEPIVEPTPEPVVEEPAVEEPPVETPPAEETPAPEPTPEPPPAETPVI